MLVGIDAWYSVPAVGSGIRVLPVYTIMTAANLERKKERDSEGGEIGER